MHCLVASDSLSAGDAKKLLVSVETCVPRGDIIPMT